MRTLNRVEIQQVSGGWGPLVGVAIGVTVGSAGYLGSYSPGNFSWGALGANALSGAVLSVTGPAAVVQTGRALNSMYAISRSKATYRAARSFGMGAGFSAGAGYSQSCSTQMTGGGSW